ncbi:MAG TPA: FtsX-like permease family protein [Vicinamibacterales bacterium]|jgi:predicted permease|nr:FtsX-like permease family protein [Vicinamibacterales bacterium]
MLRQDVLYAWRSFRRAPLVALTIVTTVGLGLGLVAAVFTLLNALVFLPDAVRQPDELVAVARQRTATPDPPRYTRTEYEALVRETGIFKAASAIGPDVDAWIDGQRLEGTLVTGNFFQVLGASAVRGRTLTPVDDDAGGQRVIVLSHRAWVQDFASDPAVIARPVLVNGSAFHVVGVMPERFRGLVPVAPDFWAPVALEAQLKAVPNEDGATGGLQVVGRLDPALPRGQAISELVAWDLRQRAARGVERPAANLVLEPKTGAAPLSNDVLALFAPLFFAFGLILLIGCANVANLLLARGVARRREIGIRLSIGASRGRIIRQWLTENLLLAIAAAALGFAISRIVLIAAVQALVGTWSSAIGSIRVEVPPADWRVGLFLVGGAVVSTILFALAPALQATRLDLVRAVRGEITRHGRPSRARGFLVALQVTGSMLLLVCATIFLRSVLAASAVDPGIRTADVLTMDIAHEPNRAALVGAIRTEPLVAEVAASWPNDIAGRPAFADAGRGRQAVTYEFASREYFDVLGIPVVKGRGFLPSERASSAVAIVSARVAGQLWPNADAVGQVLRLGVDPDRSTPSEPSGPALPPTVVVVGVTRDVPGFRLGGLRIAGAGVYLPTDAGTAGTSLTIRVHDDPASARRALVDRLTTIEPGLVADQISLLRDVAAMEAYLLGIPFWLTLVLGALALVLTISGLFSVLSYLVEQRTREIGVRMALGATRRRIAVFVLSQSAWPVAAGLFVGGGLVVALGAALMATPAAGSIGTTIRFFDPLAYAASVLGIAGACACAALLPTRKATRINPIDALRQG